MNKLAFVLVVFLLTVGAGCQPSEKQELDERVAQELAASLAPSLPQLLNTAEAGQKHDEASGGPILQELDRAVRLLRMDEVRHLAAATRVAWSTEADAISGTLAVVPESGDPYCLAVVIRADGSSDSKRVDGDPLEHCDETEDVLPPS